MAPVTRLTTASDPAAAAEVAANNAGDSDGSATSRFGQLVLGSTDEYDAPAPAPRLHAALFVVAVLPLCVDIPASFAIVATATLAILAGSWRSVKAAPPTETMTQKDAMRFPLIGRCVLCCCAAQGGALCEGTQFYQRFLTPPASPTAASWSASSSSSSSCRKT